jgi:hypothetical protein
MFGTKILEGTVMWVPWIMGITSSSLIAYYGNNFVPTDLTLVSGNTIWSGASGNAVMGVSAATLAVESVALLEFFKYVLKAREGNIKVENSNPHYSRAMMYFWWLMMFFYLVAIVSCALNVTVVSQFGNEPVGLSTSGSQLTGSFGSATLGMSYTTIGVGGLAFFLYLYAEIFAKKGAKVTMTETFTN